MVSYVHSFHVILEGRVHFRKVARRAFFNLYGISHRFLCVQCSCLMKSNKLEIPHVLDIPWETWTLSVIYKMSGSWPVLWRSLPMWQDPMPEVFHTAGGQSHRTWKTLKAFKGLFIQPIRDCRTRSTRRLRNLLLLVESSSLSTSKNR